MTDIPSQHLAHIKAFAEQMNADNWVDMRLHIQQQAEALSRLTFPLPGEIAELAERLRSKALEVYAGDAPLYDEAAVALEQMARENRALRTESNDRAGQMEQLRTELSRLTYSDLPEDIARLASFLRQRPEWGYQESADALERMARDNERLNENLRKFRARIAEWVARIRELEAERDKTIEECAASNVTVRGFGPASDDYLTGFHDGVVAKIDAIRALNQPAGNAVKEPSALNASPADPAAAHDR